MGENPSPSSEDFSIVLAWSITVSPAIRPFHLVWITKYRKGVLTVEITKRTRKLIREICRTWDVEIIRGHVGKDHVHIFVSVPPHISVIKLVQSIKGKSSRKMMSEFRNLSRQFWGRHICGRGYFVASSGNVTDEVIMQYIELQGKEPESGEFRIDGEL